MALVYNGTDTTRVPDKPSGYDPATVVFPTTVTYKKTYTLSTGKVAVDTSDSVTNFTALVADVDAQVAAILAADFEDTSSNVTAAGRITAFNLEGGTKYENTTNTSSYTYFVDVDIETIVI